MEDRDVQQITWDSTPTAHSPDLSTTDDPNRTSLAVPPIADAQPSLRTRLSRYFGLRRIPRQARPKSLTRPRSDQLQAQDTSNHLQLPPIPHHGLGRPSPTVRSIASTRTTSRPTESDPRFIGLEDRRAKVPVAIPTFVRRVDLQCSTDQTMATRGSGSGLSGPTGGELNDTTYGDRQSIDQRSREGRETSMKRRRSWASIMQRTKKLFGRMREANEQ
ncbi:hypothetical protein XPA_000622 [Xanthoria parietina]